VDIETTVNAATNGHAEVLKWAILNGCPTDNSVCAKLAKRGDLDLLKWVWKHGCQWDERLAGSRNWWTFGYLIWLRAKGCPWIIQRVRSSRRRHLNVLKWLDYMVRME